MTRLTRRLYTARRGNLLLKSLIFITFNVNKTGAIFLCFWFITRNSASSNSLYKIFLSLFLSIAISTNIV